MELGVGLAGEVTLDLRCRDALGAHTNSRLVHTDATFDPHALESLGIEGAAQPKGRVFQRIDGEVESAVGCTGNGRVVHQVVTIHAHHLQVRNVLERLAIAHPKLRFHRYAKPARISHD